MADNNGFTILPGSGGDRIVYKDGIIVATFHGVKAGSDEPQDMAEAFVAFWQRMPNLQQSYYQMQSGFNVNAGNQFVIDFMERKKQ